MNPYSLLALPPKNACHDKCYLHSCSAAAIEAAHPQYLHLQLQGQTPWLLQEYLIHPTFSRPIALAQPDHQRRIVICTQNIASQRHQIRKVLSLTNRNNHLLISGLHIATSTFFCTRFLNSLPLIAILNSGASRFPGAQFMVLTIHSICFSRKFYFISASANGIPSPVSNRYGDLICSKTEDQSPILHCHELSAQQDLY